jgi:tRNA(Ile)-lysidine synthase
VADRVEIAFRRAAEGLIPADSSVLVAVSGGGDSVALLHLLRACARHRSIELVVAHLDHGLRRGSAGDRRFVERLAHELRLPCVAERLAVARDARRRDESLEEAARRVRREFLLRAASDRRCARIATGHTLDDQAETVLMRLVRGAGATALAGMAESGPGPFVKPLLGLERDELRRYLERRKLGYREDPSNLDLRFDRNRVRRRILPVLVQSLNPRAARHLVRASGALREDALLLDALAEERLGEVCREEGADRLRLDADRLTALAPPIARRVARLALRRVGTDARRITSRHVEALLDLAHGGRGRRADLPGGTRARRDGRDVLLGPADPRLRRPADLLE